MVTWILNKEKKTEELHINNRLVASIFQAEGAYENGVWKEGVWRIKLYSSKFGEMKSRKQAKRALVAYLFLHGSESVRKAIDDDFKKKVA